MTDISLATIMAARRQIVGTAIETPLIPSPFLSSVTGSEILLKLEITQPIGAFKLRGAANAIASLPVDIAGVTCCSTGNHGRGVAFAAAKRGLRAVICMSTLVPKAKIDGIKALGAEVVIIGASQDEAQIECLRLVREEGLIEISPFDDPDVIAGQGTIGLELMEQRPDLSTVLVPLSGGGLAGGIALAVKRINPVVRMVGISMDRGPAMVDSIRAGYPVDVDELPSLADSLGGGIGLDNRHSFALCRDYLDDMILVSEAEIYRGVQALYYEDRIVCEGGSAVSTAALLAGKLPDLAGPAAMIISGRNIDMNLHADIIQGKDVTLGDLVVSGAPYAR
jgi:threonine dehydratase